MRKVHMSFQAFFILVFGVSIFLLSSVQSFAEEVEAGKKIRVVTTLFPLYDFVRIVGGDRVVVKLLLPPGVEPHSFEPKPSDFATIDSAGLFLYTSDNMEPWVSRLLPALTNQNLLVVAASNSIVHLNSDADAVVQDPHIWLNFSYDEDIVDDIVDDLISLDEEGRDYYLDRGAAYKAQLVQLDRAYAAGLKDCRGRTIYYGGHAAFGHLMTKYDLKMMSPYLGFSPDAEPTAKAIAGLVNGIREAGAKTIFYEELLDPRVARTIAEETGARIELLSAAHNVTVDDLMHGVTFIKIMEEDLAKLRSALECR